MYFIDHRVLQRNSWSPISLPIERRIDDDGFRHSPRIVAKVASQIFLLAADGVTEHFIYPAPCFPNSFSVRIQEEFRAVETQSALWIIKTGDAKPVDLSRPRIGQTNVPDMIGTFL